MGQAGNTGERVESPCVKMCKLSDDACRACGRALSEIMDYGKADNARRKEINDLAARRLRSINAVKI